MNENHDPTESQSEPSHTRPSFWIRGRLTLLLGVFVLGLLTIGLGWMLLKESPRSPALLAGDRQRLEAFLTAHDYEAFLRLMELQPPEVRSELPAEWLRRYDEIKPALKFTVREASTEKVINSEVKYQAPLLSLRWSGDGKYLVDVLELPTKRKVFDGQTGRLVSVPEQPSLLPDSDAHWPLGRWENPETVPMSVGEPLVNRLSFSFGHDTAFWQAQQNWRPVLLMASPRDPHILTSFAVNPGHVAAIGAPRKDGLGRPMPHFPEQFEEMVNVHQRRCSNVWKANVFPR